MVMSNPRAEMPEDAKFIPLEEAEEHGYWGISPDQTDRSEYGVEGAVKAGEKAKEDAKAKQEADWAKADEGQSSKPEAKPAAKTASKEAGK